MASVLLMALLNLVYHMQEFMIEPKVKGVPRGRIQKAQAKLFLVMCYYTLAGAVIITWSSYTSFLTVTRSNSESFQTYFMCQSTGVQTDLDCGQPPSNNIFHTLASVSISLTALMPAIILIFTANCTCLRKCHRSAKVPETPGL